MGQAPRPGRTLDLEGVVKCFEGNWRLERLRVECAVLVGEREEAAAMG